MDPYVFDAAWEKERDRLRALEAAFDQPTTRRPADLGVGTGWRCLEIGCGAGGVALWLARRVGVTRRVRATDLDTRFLAGHGRPNLDVRAHDITADALEPGSFDLAHTRNVLAHLPGDGQLVVSFSKLFPVPDVEEFTTGRSPSDGALIDDEPEVPWDEESLRRLVGQANPATLATLDLCAAEEATSVTVKDVAKEAGITEGAVRGQLTGLTMRLKDPSTDSLRPVGRLASNGKETTRPTSWTLNSRGSGELSRKSHSLASCPRRFYRTQRNLTSEI
jgi:SAM-dependent methyltransferase